MNEGQIFKTRRTLIFVMGLFPWLLKNASAVGPEISTAPCSFPFDASQNGSVLDVQFRVKDYRNYIFTLEFHHQGGDEGMRVLQLVGDGTYKLYTRESADTDHPATPVVPNTVEGVQRVNEGLRTGEFVRRPTDFSGAIPIHLRISRSDSQALEIITDETIQTLGHFAGGGGSIDRMITVEALKPGLYRLQANTTQDSPRFVGIPIKLGITYNAKAMPLPLPK
ncbi:MAG: DUF5625 family protein [Formivibrio sp.]|nr:DUF5625 family protein [Formivibrio sp.]